MTRKKFWYRLIKSWTLTESNQSGGQKKSETVCNIKLCHLNLLLRSCDRLQAKCLLGTTDCVVRVWLTGRFLQPFSRHHRGNVKTPIGDQVSVGKRVSLSWPAKPLSQQRSNKRGQTNPEWEAFALETFSWLFSHVSQPGNESAQRFLISSSQLLNQQTSSFNSHRQIHQKSWVTITGQQPAMVPGLKRLIVRNYEN